MSERFVLHRNKTQQSYRFDGSTAFPIWGHELLLLSGVSKLRKCTGLPRRRKPSRATRTHRDLIGAYYLFLAEGWNSTRFGTAPTSWNFPWQDMNWQFE